MHIIVKQHPVKLLLIVPLGELRKLLTHKQQLFARMRRHISVKSAQRGKLHLVLTGYFLYHRALSVHYLIMRNRHYEVFGKGVEE